MNLTFDNKLIDIFYFLIYFSKIIFKFLSPKVKYSLKKTLKNERSFMKDIMSHQ